MMALGTIAVDDGRDVFAERDGLRATQAHGGRQQKSSSQVWRHNNSPLCYKSVHRGVAFQAATTAFKPAFLRMPARLPAWQTRTPTLRYAVRKSNSRSARYQSSS